MEHQRVKLTSIKKKSRKYLLTEYLLDLLLYLIPSHQLNLSYIYMQIDIHVTG